MNANTSAATNSIELVSLGLEHGSVVGRINGVAAGVVVVALILVLLWMWLRGRLGWLRNPQFELDEVELGIGEQTLKLRPNVQDRQVAYKIWVELSTRKIGLPIDLANDVVSEIYDSWFTFFQVTRELIKDVPVNRVREQSTQKIIQLSIDVLNNGLRPHLTRWQARFRRWFEKQVSIDDNASLHLQDIQAKFEHFDELQADLLRVNKQLIAYREKMRELVLGPNAKASELRLSQLDLEQPSAAPE